MRRTPALIVGGGLAGAAAAIGLARAGLPHLLVERQTTTGDALCGGFLSWRTLEALATLGIEADAVNRVPVTSVRLFARGRSAESALPKPARSVSRRKLDAMLLAQAERVGAVVERGVTIRGIEGLVARTADGAEIDAAALFLASGKRDVRGLARPADARGVDPTLGLRMRLAPSPALDRALTGQIELHLFDGGYAGLALQEDGSANLCLAVHESRFKASDGPAALLAQLGAANPALGERMARSDGAPVEAIANVPYGWRARHGVRDLFRLGDQAGVIPSLAGEGMGIALASGIAAAEAYRRGGAAAAAGWQDGFAARLRQPMAVAGAMRQIVESRGAPAALLFARPWLIQVIARATRIGA
ncbi:NAD(P)/FAD-dependent oxidoreductase [Sphingomonas sp. Tas61C01]|uniref:NAD(P)/FAD-dependent oxidoreductase n=1 Tax=Sphingomonas sp. Tas61C01 TaxID=3458297 RepID=UPI00403E7CD2